MFPKRAPLYPGCVLGTIVNAIAHLDYGATVARCFVGNTYAYYGGDGDHFMITFQEDSLVGALFDHDSPRSPPRSPFRCEGVYDVSRFFVGMPASHRNLMEQSLRWRSEGSDHHLVTAAFWDDGDLLTAAEPWEAVWEHGGSLIRRELIEDLDQALEEWRINHNLRPELIDFCRLLFLQWQQSQPVPAEMGIKEAQFVRDLAFESNPKPPSGQHELLAAFYAFGKLQAGTGKEVYEATRATLEEVGLRLPPLETIQVQ